MRFKLLLALILCSFGVSAQYSNYGTGQLQRQIVGSDTTFRWVGSSAGNYVYGKSLHWYRNNLSPSLTFGYGLTLTGTNVKVDSTLLGTKSWVNGRFLSYYNKTETDLKLSKKADDSVTVRRTGISYTGKSIVFFGDSYTSGSGASATVYRWSTRLSSALGATEVNNGVAGTTLENRTPVNYMNGPNMTENIANIPTKTASYAMLVFAYGLNDMGQTASAYNTTNYITDYTTVLNAALAKGWLPSQILIIPPYYIGSAGYTAYGGITGNAPPTRARHISFVDATKTVSKTFGTMYVDIFRDQLKNDTTLISDGIHPNDAGYAYIASDILQYLTGDQIGNNQQVFERWGLGAPTALPSRSVGTKVVYYPGSAPNVDFAVGMEATRLWWSVTASTFGFRWYSGTAQLMDASTTNGLVVNNTITSLINAGAAKTYFLTSNGSDVYTGRTASQVLSDIGAASASSVTGLTANTIPKANTSTTLTNSSITDNGTTITLGNSVNSANITLTNGTANRLIFNASGIGAPTFTTLSAGQKIITYPGLSGSAVDFGIGIRSDAQWYSAPTTSFGHAWYSGTTETMLLSGAGNLSTQGNISTAAGGKFAWVGRSAIGSSANGLITLYNNANTDFSRLNFGGITSSFPSIKRTSTTLNVRLADDSGDANLSAASQKLTGDLQLTNIASGTAGTDSILVKKSADNKVYKIPADYYATSTTTLTSGTYTPTISNTTNVASTSAIYGFYKRIGNIVTVEIELSVTATANNLSTALDFSLPIASNFANSHQGTGFSVGYNPTYFNSGYVYSESVNDVGRLIVLAGASATSGDTVRLTFTYSVI